MALSARSQLSRPCASAKRGVKPTGAESSARKVARPGVCACPGADGPRGKPGEAAMVTRWPRRFGDFPIAGKGFRSPALPTHETRTRLQPGAGPPRAG